jgi:hypothetical protein
MHSQFCSSSLTSEKSGIEIFKDPIEKVVGEHFFARFLLLLSIRKDMGNKRRGADSLFALVAWEFWKERNGRCFHDGSSSVRWLLGHIKQFGGPVD